jgi:predicted DNA-binding transcriptional regulator AlpA
MEGKAMKTGEQGEAAKVQLPEIGFLKLRQIIGRPGQAAIVPVSKSGWYEGIKAGRYPRPVKLGERAVGWRVEDIRRLVSQIGIER